MEPNSILLSLYKGGSKAINPTCTSHVVLRIVFINAKALILDKVSPLLFKDEVFKSLLSFKHTGPCLVPIYLLFKHLGTVMNPRSLQLKFKVGPASYFFCISPIPHV